MSMTVNTSAADDAIRRAYQATRESTYDANHASNTSDDAPSSAMDDRIRAAARRAAHAGPRVANKSWLTRYRIPLSAAAVVMLSSSLMMVAVNERAELRSDTSVELIAAKPVAANAPAPVAPQEVKISEVAKEKSRQSEAELKRDEVTRARTPLTSTVEKPPPPPPAMQAKIPNFVPSPEVVVIAPSAPPAALAPAPIRKKEAPIAPPVVPPAAPVATIVPMASDAAAPGADAYRAPPAPPSSRAALSAPTQPPPPVMSPPAAPAPLPAAPVAAAPAPTSTPSTAPKISGAAQSAASVTLAETRRSVPSGNVRSFSSDSTANAPQRGPKEVESESAFRKSDTVAQPIVADKANIRSDGISVQSWILQLTELKRAGKDAEFRRELTRFRKTFPNEGLPKELVDFEVELANARAGAARASEPTKPTEADAPSSPPAETPPK
jgi:hypothetical protein